jgi:hypothetical protein
VALTLTHILEARYRVHQRRSGENPASLICQATVYGDIMRLAYDNPIPQPHTRTELEQAMLDSDDPALRFAAWATIPEYDHVIDPQRPVFGLEVKVSDYLPTGVWRLADPDGALLYDPREGRTLRQVLQGDWPGGDRS